MRERGSPAKRTLAKASRPGAALRRASASARSTAATARLAFFSAVGLAGAVMALLPAAVRGKPHGRRAPPRPRPDLRPVSEADRAAEATPGRPARAARR